MSNEKLQERTITYDDGITRKFVFASVGWGIIGMLLGVTIAAQLLWHQLNFLPEVTFGRLRPLHTNAVIFAFVGNMMFAGIYYSTQRLLKARMASDLLSKIHFWGWQAIIASAVVTLPLGFTQGKEYAELEWPVDLAITAIWVVFAVNFFWTLAKRREKHLYVAIWFYIATILTVAVLHIFNALSLPLSAMKSYPIYAGVQDALVQWWYGHNAVAFFLTTPILGIMYYFVPKAAERPVYSYRLSIIHFWALVFMYIWAGPHHLLYTALPVWAQTLGMIFSLMLWVPSWGGMINGLLTIRGAWDKMRVDPVLKFFAAGITFYGMATFEGPLLSIKSVSALAHYTDWIIGHVHTGALGWNGLMAAGMFYWLVPKLYRTKLYSTSLANLHFWLASLGILLYMTSMWAAGVTQGLMLSATNSEGALVYPDFIETLVAIRGMYYARLAGGTMFLTGMILMAYNLTKTALSGEAVNGTATVVEEVKEEEKEPSTKEMLLARPLVIVALALVAMTALFFAKDIQQALIALAVMSGLGIAGWFVATQKSSGKSTWHRVLEGRAALFSVLALLDITVGSVVELIPVIMVHGENTNPKKFPPYKPLELEGRDIYVREGCYTCHSQMIRPFRHEQLRYGAPSELEESAWDHPFQWGSRRTGPDLARVGVKYPHIWHYKHLVDPRSVAPASIMPPYAFLNDRKVDLSQTPAKITMMKNLGVPYTDAQIQNAQIAAKEQATAVVADLKSQGVNADPESDMVALIAYLQRLGKPESTPAVPPVAKTEK